MEQPAFRFKNTTLPSVITANIVENNLCNGRTSSITNKIYHLEVVDIFFKIIKNICKIKTENLSELRFTTDSLMNGIKFWGFKKHFPYVETFQRCFDRFHESGLTNFWWGKKWMKEWKYSIDMRECKEYKPLRFVDFSGIFLLLGVGLCAGGVCFVLEVMWFNFRKMQIF